MPFQDPPPAVLAPIFIEIYREIGPFRMPLRRLRRQSARDAFLKPLRQRLKRSHLMVEVDRRWIFVTNMGVGGCFRVVPWSTLARYRGILQLIGPRLTNRRAS